MFSVLLMLSVLESPEYWIGLSDIGVEGSYLWTDGTHTEYTDWDASEPRAHMDKADCVRPRKEGWRYTKCDRELPYICEVSMII